ncbi:hypothetical protein M0R45_018631 [Rubus argutus]|uniref:GATA-type domain-containing protein n=1 Tax=Rubus argutus TaxID=59490 RepID=A0AAW1X4G1_RUBAR
MALHGPDEFLADVSEDRDYPGLLVPATVKLAKEEELEWQSSKDAFHAVETRMLSNAQQQNHRVSASVVEAGIGKSLLRSMPARKCKKTVRKYKCGRLCPEYRPANSPTFSGKLQSNAHRKVMEMRKQKYGTVSKPVNICTTTFMKSKKDSFPAVEILNILEQSSGVVIAEQQSPVLVLESSTNRSATLISSCGTNEPPHQTPRKFMGHQQLFCNQANYKPNKKDTANVEIEGNSPAAMRYCGTLESPHQVPSEFLGQQQLFCNQPDNESNKKDTAKVRIEGKCQNCGIEHSPQWWEGPLGPKTLCLSCGLAKDTARWQRSISLASNKKCNKKDTAKVEMPVKPVDKCTTTLMKLKKDPFPAVETLNISEQPSVIVIAEKQRPVFVLENCRNSSMTLMNSSGTVDPTHQAPSKFLGQQQQFCDQANNKPKENDTATVEIEGNSTTLMSASGTLEPPHQPPNEFLEQQQLFCKQANNKPNKKDTARVESEGNSTTLMSSCRTTKPPHQAQSEFLRAAAAVL